MYFRAKQHVAMIVPSSLKSRFFANLQEKQKLMWTAIRQFEKIWGIKGLNVVCDSKRKPSFGSS